MAHPHASASAVHWRAIDGSGSEYCRLRVQPEPSLDGCVVVQDAAPWFIEYQVCCDPDWSTRRVSLRARIGQDERTLNLEVAEDGRWTIDGYRRPDLEGCLDVDLGFSPSTNTLPIRRLKLEKAQSGTIEAAWVEFPTLVVHRVAQRYTRLGERTYRFENVPSGFNAEIVVDGNGLVVSYPPGWERVDADNRFSTLFSEVPSAELGDASKLYEGLIGRWDVQVIDHDDVGTRRTSRGEWHFGWALEGRAIQDVFIVPARQARGETTGSTQNNRFGTTIRFYDRARQAWRIVWVNPVSGALNLLDARKHGEGIVQEGVNAEGKPIRWSFVEIARDRFHWVGEESSDGGATWQTRAEFFGRRTSFVPLR